MGFSYFCIILHQLALHHVSWFRLSGRRQCHFVWVHAAKQPLRHPSQWQVGQEHKAVGNDDHLEPSVLDFMVSGWALVDIGGLLH